MFHRCAIDKRLPADLYGDVFVAEPAANLVSRIVLDDSGPTLRARKAYPEGEFLASTDERFRPVNLSSAPDGTLYGIELLKLLRQRRPGALFNERFAEYLERMRTSSPLGVLGEAMDQAYLLLYLADYLFTIRRVSQQVGERSIYNVLCGRNEFLQSFNEGCSSIRIF